MPEKSISINKNYHEVDNNFSTESLIWIHYYEKMHNCKVQSALNGMEKMINFAKNDNIKVDGFISETNTVLQFHGCYWHGCPKCYKSDDINNDRKCTMGELNNKTIEISNKIKNAGYNLIEMYECEWGKMLINARETIKKLENKQNKTLSQIFKYEMSHTLIDHINNIDIEYYKPLNPRDALYRGRTGAVKLCCKVGNV